MEILIYIVLTLLILSFTYVYYVAVMSFKRKWEQLSLRARIAAAPQVIIGILLDVILNILMSPIFLEFPRELLLTSKLQRFRKTGSGYRLRLADSLCENWLNPFDENHC